MPPLTTHPFLPPASSSTHRLPQQTPKPCHKREESQGCNQHNLVTPQTGRDRAARHTTAPHGPLRPSAEPGHCCRTGQEEAEASGPHWSHEEVRRAAVTISKTTPMSAQRERGGGQGGCL
uniref:Uncharacterized protein n=1 Tax=Knipowitschia caucasica TaxID=637954 RepID=A0AAV2M5U7_KNICA